jgi:hypothetical protein
MCCWWLQAPEILRVAVQRIASVKPDVVLVERTVAQSAKADFEGRGISLAFNVKRELLDRLARGLGTKVGGWGSCPGGMGGGCLAFDASPT